MRVASKLNEGFPPYVAIPAIRNPKLSQIPDVTRFQQLCDGEKLIKSYRIRVRRPKFPWVAAITMLAVMWFLSPLVLGLLLAWHFLRRRGHTFLYLTNRRVIILELEEAAFGRRQTILNYSIESISGFSVLAQRGLKKLLNFILLKEKRTFYISITTRTLATCSLGSENSLNSEYDPGQDAVSLCAELDALVLAIKDGRL